MSGAQSAQRELAEQAIIAECGSSQETCVLLNGVSSYQNSSRLSTGSTFGRVPLTWMLVGRVSQAQARVLVLLDVSGSMQGSGIASARPALQSLLATLSQTATEVAIAPFESHSVATRIRSASFGSARSASLALAAVPSPRGNTALYSAVKEGAVLLASRPGKLVRHLVVITDGVNDIRTGDDAGLLTGPAGLREAVDATERLGVQVWTVGVGKSPDREELAALAGSADRSQVVAEDPLLLARALNRIGERFVTGTRLLFGTAAPPILALGARSRGITAVVEENGALREVAGRWTPPLFASPVRARTFGEVRPADAAGTGSGLHWWRWILLLMPLGIVFICATPVVAAVETRDSSPGGKLSIDSSGVRSDVRESRPRLPTEITASRAERIVRLQETPQE